MRVEEDDVIGYRVLHEKLFEVPEPKVGDLRRLGLNHFVDNKSNYQKKCRKQISEINRQLLLVPQNDT